MVNIVCHCCKGSGFVELTGCYAKTLAVLRCQRHGRELLWRAK